MAPSASSTMTGLCIKCFILMLDQSVDPRLDSLSYHQLSIQQSYHTRAIDSRSRVEREQDLSESKLEGSRYTFRKELKSNLRNSSSMLASKCHLNLAKSLLAPQATRGRVGFFITNIYPPIRKQVVGTFDRTNCLLAHTLIEISTDRREM